jgi:phenylpropionate dioxygenase-like ring-hydroxylating dioxygenase large terminal subunit
MPRPIADSPRSRELTEPWRETWFPVAFAIDLPSDEIRRVSIFDRGYILFTDATGRLACLLDRCPHRAARLSNGRLHAGRIECLYHGWQFDGSGRCLHIPQFAADQPIPASACTPAVPLVVRQGLVWLYGGSRTDPDAAAIPVIDQVPWEQCRSIDFAIDLPYGQDFLIENVLDYAHIHIAHHGVRGGGHRDRARPLSFEVSEAGPAGFTARFGMDGQAGPDALTGATVEFAAPNLVHYRSFYRDPARCSGLALYALPLGSGRSRLLYRAYHNFAPWRDRIRPRFWEHGHQCHLLEQDMAVLIGQADEIRRSGTTPSDMWLPLKSSDTLVLRYRQWLDQYAAGQPDFIGFRNRGPGSGHVPHAGLVDRWTLHTSQCASCLRALRTARFAQRWLSPLAFALLAMACIVPADGSWRYLLASSSLLALAGSLAARAMCRRLLAPG